MFLIFDAFAPINQYLSKGKNMLRKTGINLLLFVLIFSACKTQHSIDHSVAERQEIKTISASPKYDSLISPFKLVLNKKMSKELVLCTSSLTKDGHEMTIGNFMCDAMKWAYDSVMKQNSNCIVLMNRGGIRTNLNKGMITVNSIFELMPFENEIELVEIKGTDLNNIIKAILEKKHGFYGMKIVETQNKMWSASIDNKAIDSSATYQILTSDFLVNGGDNFTFGQHKISSKRPNLKIRDALIYYCMHLTYTGKTLTPYTDGRFELAK